MLNTRGIGDTLIYYFLGIGNGLGRFAFCTSDMTMTEPPFSRGAFRKQHCFFFGQPFLTHTSVSADFRAVHGSVRVTGTKITLVHGIEQYQRLKRRQHQYHQEVHHFPILIIDQRVFQIPIDGHYAICHVFQCGESTVTFCASAVWSFIR